MLPENHPSLWKESKVRLFLQSSSSKKLEGRNPRQLTFDPGIINTTIPYPTPSILSQYSVLSRSRINTPTTMLGTRIDPSRKLSAPRPQIADSVRSAQPECCLSDEKSSENSQSEKTPIWDTRPRCRSNESNVKVLRAPGVPIQGDGKSHVKTQPTRWKISINDPSGPKEWSLLDNCSGLSLMSQEMHEKYFSPLELNKEVKLTIGGIGIKNSIGYVVTSIFAESDSGEKVQFDVEFHVLPSFRPGFCVGIDTMSSFGINILNSSHRAHLPSLKLYFPIWFDRSTQKSAKLTCAAETIIPPRTHAQKPLKWSCQNPEVDHMVEPLISMRSIDETFGMSPRCLISGSAKSLMYSNFGKQPIILKKGDKVGRAIPLRVDNRVKPTNECMELSSNSNECFSASNQETTYD